MLANSLARQFITHEGTQAKLEVHVFLDKGGIQYGDDWEKKFLFALRHSIIMIPLISEKALERVEKNSDPTADNVIAEYLTAINLMKKGRLRILPIYIGKVSGMSGSVADFDDEKFGSSRLPKTNIHGQPVRKALSAMQNIPEFLDLVQVNDDDDLLCKDQHSRLQSPVEVVMQVWF